MSKISWGRGHVPGDFSPHRRCWTGWHCRCPAWRSPGCPLAEAAAAARLAAPAAGTAVQAGLLPADEAARAESPERVAHWERAGPQRRACCCPGLYRCSRQAAPAERPGEVHCGGPARFAAGLGPAGWVEPAEAAPDSGDQTVRDALARSVQLL